jgi:hypothetical protein
MFATAMPRALRVESPPPPQDECEVPDTPATVVQRDVPI